MWKYLLKGWVWLTWKRRLIIRFYFILMKTINPVPSHRSFIPDFLQIKKSELPLSAPPSHSAKPTQVVPVQRPLEIDRFLSTRVQCAEFEFSTCWTPQYLYGDSKGREAQIPHGSLYSTSPDRKHLHLSHLADALIQECTANNISAFLTDALYRAIIKKRSDAYFQDDKGIWSYCANESQRGN
jgi:hypothetical protein